MWIGEIEIEIVLEWKFNSATEKSKSIDKGLLGVHRKIIKRALDLINLLQQWIYRALRGIIAHVGFVLIASE